MDYFDVLEQMFIEHTFYRTNVCTNDYLVMRNRTFVYVRLRDSRWLCENF